MIERGTDQVVLREPQPFFELLLGGFFGLLTLAALGGAGVIAWSGGAAGDAGPLLGVAAIVAVLALASGGRAWLAPVTTMRLDGHGVVARPWGRRAFDAKDLLAVRVGPLVYSHGWSESAKVTTEDDARIDALLADGRQVALWRGERATEAERAAALAAVTGLLPPGLPVFAEATPERLAPIPHADRPGWLRLASPWGKNESLLLGLGLGLAPCAGLAVAMLRSGPHGQGPFMPLALVCGFLGLLGLGSLWVAQHTWRHPAGLIVDGARRALVRVGDLRPEELVVPFETIEGLVLIDDPERLQGGDVLLVRHAGREDPIWRIIRPLGYADDGRWAATIAARVLAHLPPGTPLADRRTPREAQAAVRKA